MQDPKHCWELYADLSGQGAGLELVDVLVALLVAGPHQVRLQPQQGRRGRHVADSNGESSGTIYSFMFKPEPVDPDPDPAFQVNPDTDQDLGF
jgi:hypothetical protein